MKKKPDPKISDVPARVVAYLHSGKMLRATLCRIATVEDTGSQTIVVVGDGGKATAGYDGSAIAGLGGTAIALRGGLAYVLSGDATCLYHAGISIVRGEGTARAVDTLSAVYGGGHAIMEGAGIAIAINPPDSVGFDSTAQASPGGLIILGYTDHSCKIPRIRYVVAKVGVGNIEGNKPYKLDKANICSSSWRPLPGPVVSPPTPDQNAPIRLVTKYMDNGNTHLNERLLDSPSTPTIVTDTGERAVVVTGDNGDVTAGCRGTAIAGRGSKATALAEGFSYVRSGDATCVGPNGIAISVAGRSAIAAGMLAAAYRGGHAVMVGGGIAIAMNDFNATHLWASAQAGYGGLIVVGRFVCTAGRWHLEYAHADVDGEKIKENTPYKMDDEGNLVEA